MSEQMARIDEYRVLSDSEKSKVRAYRSRFRKRGMTDFDAHEEAMNLVAGYPIDESQPPLFSDEELPPSRNSSKQSATGVAEALFWAKPLFLVVAAICCTGFLVWCTARALGGDLSAWFTASLLEVGIVALFCFSATSVLFRLFCRSLGFCGVAISLALLHGGVAADYESKSVGAEQRERLLESREQLVALVADLPKSHVTKREQLLQRVADVDMKLGALATSSVLEVESLKLSESSLRLFIVFFNLVCAHLLVRLWKETYG